MTCASFQLWIVSDDHQDRRRAEEHAAECPRCQEILIGQQALRDQVLLWSEESAAPEHLEEKIRHTLVASIRRPVLSSQARTGSERPRRRSRLWIALAASFLLGIGLGVFKLPAESAAPLETRRLLNATALGIAAEEEEAQRQAIADLEAQVAPILARARDKSLATHRAARLMEYRARLATLNVTIEDVRGFVRQNPGHPRARTMLLDAYKEKKDVLREVIALEERSS